MEGCSGKRAVDGLVVSERRTGLVSRERAKSGDKTIQNCSRVGCSARIRSLDKAKSVRPSVRSSPSGKEVVGKSSLSFSRAGNAQKSLAKPDPKPSSSKTSSVRDQPEASASVSPPGKIRKGLSARSECISSATSGSSSVASSTRSLRTVHQRSGLGSRETLVGSSHSGSQTARSTLCRNGLRTLKCSSLSDVTSSRSSSTDSSLSRRKDILEKRGAIGESSSSVRSKKSSVSEQARNQNPTRGVLISDARRNRQLSANANNPVSSSTARRPTTCYGRVRSSGQGKGNSTSVNSPLSARIPASPAASYSRPNSRNDRLRSIPGSPARTTPSLSRNSLREYNADNVAEVLLALERIEQDEELTYEQMLALETNLFLSSVNFYDRHRDMRLDIDNMSYEELLALEERIGNVSTGISEETLFKCIKTSTYKILLDDETGGSCLNKEDVKCSVCQEEYMEGDELGRLNCEHKYHFGCIQQWLRMKNWCPICKTSAEPSSPLVSS